ncbi:type II toxin-antitoxin system prevent-host-death family antitoxin [soil metagenome]
MSDAISISEAKTQLSRLVARAERGEDVVIRRGRQPVVRLVSLATPRSEGSSPVGILRGQIRIAEDVDDLGPEWDAYR